VLKKEGVTMSVSEAQKKANRQWDKENMITLGCKVKREQAEKFKKYAANNGKTANALLKDFVLEKISENEGE
jgi:hypothetical protein